MGLSDATKALDTAPAAIPMVEKSKASTASAGEFSQTALQKKFAADGAALRNGAEFKHELEGSRSDDIEFITCLGNPAKRAPRVKGTETLDASLVVGYTFKALKDIQVPVSPFKPNFHSLTDTETPTFVEVKAGTIFHLNPNETGFLASQPEYAGAFTGNGNSVVLSVKFSKDRNEVPLPVLRKTSGAIKDSLLDIADQDKENPKKFTVKPEYAEKFGILFAARKSSKTAAGVTIGDGEARKNVAAAFNAYFRNRA